MQLDLPQFLACKANDSIEKPFDTEEFRAKLEKLLPNLKSFPLKNLLNMPRPPNIIEDDEFIKQKTTYESLSEAEKANIRAIPGEAPASATPAAQTTDNKQAPATPAGQPAGQAPAAAKPETEVVEEKKDDWSPSTANQFVIETENLGDYEEVKSINSLNDEPDLQDQINEQIQNYIKDSPVASHRAQTALPQKQTFSAFDEQLIREEIRQIAERVCWQVIPEVTERVVREELAKLLKGIESNT